MIARRALLAGFAVFWAAGLASTVAEAKPFFLFRPFADLFNRGKDDDGDVRYMTEEEYYRYLKRQRRDQGMPDSSYDRWQDEPPPPKTIKRQAAPRTKAPQKAATAEPDRKASPSAPVNRAVNAKNNVNNNKANALAASRKASPVSCTEAQQIVSGYGFDAVRPGSCSGSVFSFNANRAGKTYSVKVNSATGELTEVKKL